MILTVAARRAGIGGGALAACLFGPGVLPQPLPPLTVGECLDVFDWDSDNDVDLTDFASFQAAITD